MPILPPVNPLRQFLRAGALLVCTCIHDGPWSERYVQSLVGRDRNLAGGGTVQGRGQQPAVHALDRGPSYGFDPASVRPGIGVAAGLGVAAPVMDFGLYPSNQGDIRRPRCSARSSPIPGETAFGCPPIRCPVEIDLD